MGVILSVILNITIFILHATTPYKSVLWYLCVRLTGCKTQRSKGFSTGLFDTHFIVQITKSHKKSGLKTQLVAYLEDIASFFSFPPEQKNISYSKCSVPFVKHYAGCLWVTLGISATPSKLLLYPITAHQSFSPSKLQPAQSLA